MKILLVLASILAVLVAACSSSPGSSSPIKPSDASSSTISEPATTVGAITSTAPEVSYSSCEVVAESLNPDLEDVTYYPRSDIIWLTGASVDGNGSADSVEIYDTNLSRAGSLMEVGQWLSSPVTTEDFLYVAGSDGSLLRVDRVGVSEELWAPHPPIDYNWYDRTKFAETPTGSPSIVDTVDTSFSYMLSDDAQTILAEPFNSQTRFEQTYRIDIVLTRPGSSDTVARHGFDIEWVVSPFWPYRDAEFSTGHEILGSPEGTVDVAGRHVIGDFGSLFDVYDLDVNYLYTLLQEELLEAAGKDGVADEGILVRIRDAGSNLLWADFSTHNWSYLVAIQADSGKIIDAVEVGDREGYAHVVLSGNDWVIAGFKDVLHLVKVQCS